MRGTYCYESELFSCQMKLMENIDGEGDDFYTDGTPTENLSKREEVGDFVSWDSAGGRARGRIVEIKKEGSIKVPGTDFEIKCRRRRSSSPYSCICRI
jgi:hypothetical protein